MNGEPSEERTGHRTPPFSARNRVSFKPGQTPNFGAIWGTNREPARYMDFRFDLLHLPCNTLQICAIPYRLCGIPTNK